MAKEDRTQNLVGIDAAPQIRAAQKELADMVREGRRRTEVDGVRDTETPMAIDVLVFEEARGWRMETLRDPFPGADGPIVVREVEERMLGAEMRFRVAEYMVGRRYADARRARAAVGKATLTVHGRVRLADNGRSRA